MILVWESDNYIGSNSQNWYNLHSSQSWWDEMWLVKTISTIKRIVSQDINILLVEDHRLISDFILRFVWDEKDVHLVITETRKETLKALEDNNFDLILLDGYLRDNETTKDFPEIIKKSRKSDAWIASTSTCEIMNMIHKKWWADEIIDKWDLLQYVMKYIKNRREKNSM
jgi:DNA-binding NtrC family response regulator